MTQTLSGTAQSPITDQLTAPADGDPRNAASVNQPIQSLLDKIVAMAAAVQATTVVSVYTQTWAADPPTPSTPAGVDPGDAHWHNWTGTGAQSHSVTVKNGDRILAMGSGSYSTSVSATGYVGIGDASTSKLFIGSQQRLDDAKTTVPFSIWGTWLVAADATFTVRFLFACDSGGETVSLGSLSLFVQILPAVDV